MCSEKLMPIRLQFGEGPDSFPIFISYLLTARNVTPDGSGWSFLLHFFHPFWCLDKGLDTPAG